MATVECPHCNRQIETQIEFMHVRYRCACGGRYILVYRDGQWQAVLPTPTPAGGEVWKGSKNIEGAR